ncbi:quinoprotein dehydrogenase-associated SoxYZ-like carrier [Dokdonella sp. MW10]|uniref:quinoprotein dehydrogenase-associated SoxYZ-like carrier n=1 Tax=Dokdonella sp. MW10 TaxID=2992926 RepID=UPI003F7E49AB
MARSSFPIHAVLAATLAAGLCVAPSALGIGEAQQPVSGMWEALRDQWYADTRIDIAGDAFMRLEVPANTPDPAATPLGIRFGPDAIGHVRQLRIVVDNNPAPLVATVALREGTPVETLDLRVRVDRYTSVRAIAETDDGRVLMRSTWVKASGGCSAPPSPAAGGTPGEIRLRGADDARALLVSVRHPNHSGFQIDPRSGEAIPPYYVSSIVLDEGGTPLVDAQTTISMSENPSLRIGFAKALPKPIEVRVADSADGHFKAAWTGGGSDATTP